MATYTAMKRIYNFSAGPAALPDEVRLKVADSLSLPEDFKPSVMEIIHRGPEFGAIAERLFSGLRSLMGLDDDYEILLLQGGAQLQFAMLPMNLAGGGRAAYVETGYWSRKALRAARQVIGEKAVLAGSSEGDDFTGLPDLEALPDGCAYLHYCSNETIHGVQFPGPPRADVPLVADLTSDIFSGPFDFTCLGGFYASAQKNLGVAGATLVVLRRDLLERVPEDLVAVLNYRNWLDEGSMLNTPCTFAWYVALEVVEWIGRQGGLEVLGERNRAKARTLYGTIDSGDFYSSRVNPGCRSLVSVPFSIHDPKLEPLFVREAADAGLVGLKGHRAVGGLRACMYNAADMAAVESLTGFMREFERRRG